MDSGEFTGPGDWCLTWGYMWLQHGSHSKGECVLYNIEERPFYINNYRFYNKKVKKYDFSVEFSKSLKISKTKLKSCFWCTRTEFKFSNKTCAVYIVGVFMEVQKTHQVSCFHAIFFTFSVDKSNNFEEQNKVYFTFYSLK